MQIPNSMLNLAFNLAFNLALNLALNLAPNVTFNLPLYLVCICHPKKQLFWLEAGL